MAKEYIPKQFAPHIYPEWGELFEELTAEQNSEILFAITKFPNYEPKGVPVWKFIKSQLQKDFENFTAKCKKRGEAARTYWGNKGEQMISNDNKSITNNIKGEPKRITNNEITNNELRIIETETEIKTQTQKPTKNEIEDYCRQLGRHINIDDFIAYYSVDDWLDDNGMPINWKRKIVSWSMRQKEKKEKPQSINDGLF